jgi:acyl-CoA reductase-like NAD-dependent aldehyde dehydrogenase
MCLSVLRRLQSTDAPATFGIVSNNSNYSTQGLRTTADRICDAIAQDLGFTQEEVNFEFLRATTSVRDLYNQLDIQSALDQEYSVANNKDNIARRVPVGIVLIRPCQHSRLFSIISPVVAALAAGNCVIIEVGTSLWHFAFSATIEIC